MHSNSAWQQTLVHDDASSCVICQINSKHYTSIVNVSASFRLHDNALHTCAPYKGVTYAAQAELIFVLLLPSLCMHCLNQHVLSKCIQRSIDGA